MCGTMLKPTEISTCHSAAPDWNHVDIRYRACGLGQIRVHMVPIVRRQGKHAWWRRVITRWIEWRDPLLQITFEHLWIMSLFWVQCPGANFFQLVPFKLSAKFTSGSTWKELNNSRLRHLVILWHQFWSYKQGKEAYVYIACVCVVNVLRSLLLLGQLFIKRLLSYKCNIH